MHEMLRRKVHKIKINLSLCLESKIIFNLLFLNMFKVKYDKHYVTFFQVSEVYFTNWIYELEYLIFEKN